MHKTKRTVTVGIPAHNEEQNIRLALESVLRQRGALFTLERIIVVSDGSTDQTESIVREMAQSNPLIELVADHERKGKITRLNQLCRMNTSDFLVFLDADTVYEGESDLDEAIRAFGEDESVLVVASHEIPVKAETFVERINNAGCYLWDEIRLFVNGGNHIHNLRGSASVVRKKLTDILEYPVELTTDPAFLYLKATEKNSNGFRYAHKSHILYYSPNNLEECRLQGTRSIVDHKEHVAKHFGKGVYEKFHIPVRYKIQAMVKRMLRDPIFTALAILLAIYVRLCPLRGKSPKQYTWKIVASTKRKISRPIPDFRMKEVY